MSLETEIQNLTAAVENLAFIIKQSAVIHPQAMHSVEKTTTNIYAPLRTDDEVKSAPVVVKPAPMPEPLPVVLPPPAVAMPPVPTFAPSPVVPQVTHGKAPFNDAKGLMDYLMKSYTTLGSEKGAKIQDVMKMLGANAVNEVKPEQYDALFAGVEALK